MISFHRLLIVLIAVVTASHRRRRASPSSEGLPLTLSACQQGATDQIFALLPQGNGTSVSSNGYCLDIQHFGQTAGSTVYAWPCGQGGARDNEHWVVVRNGNTSSATIASAQPGTPFCIGIHDERSSGSALVDCASPDAQFTVSFSTVGTNGTIRREGSPGNSNTSLCLTAAGPTAPTPAPAPTPCPPRPPASSHARRNSASPNTVADAATLPCDVYGAGGTPCVAAHSTVRALYGAYGGALYAVTRASDKATLDIGVLEPGGIADASAQDAFCSGSDCVVTRVYDQSPRQNHLGIFRGLQANSGDRSGSGDTGVNASRDAHTVGGRSVYAMYFEPDMGYRNDSTNGLALGAESQSMYWVIAGTHYNDHCCFDYGNAETNDKDDGPGTMETLSFGNKTAYWKRQPINGTGPWLMADLEKGMYPGDDNVDPDALPTLGFPYVTGMLKGRACDMVLKAGDATKGMLMTLYDGQRPEHAAYEPPKKQGAIILGTGGDNSRHAMGTFFEGAITTGFADDATDDAIQANIVAAGYGQKQIYGRPNAN